MLRSSVRGAVGLRLIAAYKLIKATILILAGFVVMRLDPGHAVADTVRLASRLRLDPDNRLIHTAIARLSGLQPRQLEVAGVGVVLYGLLFGLEGVGLLLQRRWAEYLVVCTTGFLIPVEVFEVVRGGGPLRSSVLLANVAVVVYLAMLLRRQGAAAPRAGPPADSEAK